MLEIKLVTTGERKKKLVSEANYHTTKWFDKEFLAIEMNKTKILMNKPVYLGQAILDISKTLMYEFWYDYLKPKYGDKVKPCYMDTDSFIMHVETEDFYKDIANDVDKWFDTFGYNENDHRPLPIGKNKKIIGKFKDELNSKMMIELCNPMAKIYAFIADNDTEIKRVKGTKKCVIKHMLTFENYKESVLKNKTILRSQLTFKSDGHNVYTKEINNTQYAIMMIKITNIRRHYYISIWNTSS